MRPQDQQPRQGEGWLARGQAQSPAVQAAAMEGQPVALDLAEKAVCKLVYGAPRPRSLLLPVGLELWLYAQKIRNLQRTRCGGRLGRAGGGCWPRAQGTVGGFGVSREGRASSPRYPAQCSSGGPPHISGGPCQTPPCLHLQQYPVRVPPTPLISGPRFPS